MSSGVDLTKPRNCHLKRWADFEGYGFHLHAQMGQSGQFVKDISPGSPAAYAGLKEYDRIIEVNGHNVDSLSLNHREVVKKIKGRKGQVTLLVVDIQTDQMYKNSGQKIQSDDQNVINIYSPEENPTPVQGPIIVENSSRSLAADFDLVHLATFTVDSGEEMNEKNILVKLYDMESSNGLSCIKVKMTIDYTEVIIVDISTNDILERFPLDQMKDVFSLLDKDIDIGTQSKVLQNLLVLTIADVDTDIHVFQVSSGEASGVAGFLKMSSSLCFENVNSSATSTPRPNPPMVVLDDSFSDTEQTNKRKRKNANTGDVIEILDSDSETEITSVTGTSSSPVLNKKQKIGDQTSLSTYEPPVVNDENSSTTNSSEAATSLSKSAGANSDVTQSDLAAKSLANVASTLLEIPSAPVVPLLPIIAHAIQNTSAEPALSFIGTSPMTSNTTANTAPTVFQNNVNTSPGSNYLINLNNLPQDLLSNIANFIQKSSCSSTQSPSASATSSSTVFSTIPSNTVFSTIPSSTVLSTATNSTVLSGTTNNSTVLNSIIAPHASTLKEVMSIDPATGQPLSSYASAVLSTFLQAAATQAAAIQPSVSQPAFSQPAFSQPAVSGSGSSLPKRTGVIVIAPEEDNSESDCPASDREDDIDDSAPVVPVSCFMKQTTFQQPESRDITPINITPFGNYTPVPGNSHQPGPTTFSCQSSIINIYQPPTVGSNGENQQQSAINNTYQPAAGTTFSCDSSVINIYQPKPGETGSSVINNNLPVGIPGSGMRTPPGSMINNYDRTTTVNSYQSCVISSSINSTPPNPVYNSSIYNTGHTNPIVIQPIGDPISEEEQTTVEDFEFQGVVVSPDDNDSGLTTLSGLAKFSDARDITLTPPFKKKESGTHRKAVLPKAAAATCQSYIIPYSNIETCCIFCPPHFPKVIGNQLVKHLYEKHRCMKCQRMFKSDMYGNINSDTHYCVDATATDMVDCFICGRRHVLTDLFPCIGTHLRAKIHLKCQLSNCFRIFEGKADFMKHAQENHKMEADACDDCGYTCASKAILSEHVYIGCKKAICGLCKVEFTDMVMLELHQFLWHEKDQLKIASEMVKPKVYGIYKGIASRLSRKNLTTEQKNAGMIKKKKNLIKKKKNQDIKAREKRQYHKKLKKDNPKTPEMIKKYNEKEKLRRRRSRSQTQKEGAIAYKLWKEVQEKREEKQQEIIERKPAPYKHIKTNQPVGSVTIYKADPSEVPRCECHPAMDNPCGDYSDCINRMTLEECHPAVCPAAKWLEKYCHKEEALEQYRRNQRDPTSPLPEKQPQHLPQLVEQHGAVFKKYKSRRKTIVTDATPLGKNNSPSFILSGLNNTIAALSKSAVDTTTTDATVLSVVPGNCTLMSTTGTDNLKTTTASSGNTTSTSSGNQAKTQSVADNPTLKSSHPTDLKHNILHKCVLCQKYFSSNDAVMQHFRDVHMEACNITSFHLTKASQDKYPAIANLPIFGNTPSITKDTSEETKSSSVTKNTTGDTKSSSISKNTTGDTKSSSIKKNTTGDSSNKDSEGTAFVEKKEDADTNAVKTPSYEWNMNRVIRPVDLPLYEPGALVFLKVKGYPAWPARINPRVPSMQCPKDKFPMFFFGTHETYNAGKSELSLYKINKKRLGVTKKKYTSFNIGLQEIKNNPWIKWPSDVAKPIAKNKTISYDELVKECKARKCSVQLETLMDY